MGIVLGGLVVSLFNFTGLFVIMGTIQLCAAIYQAKILYYGKVQKVIRKSLEGLELLGKTAVQQVTGTGEYDTTKKDDNKILPPEEKQKIKSQEAQMLAQFNQQIEAIRKKREVKPQEEEQKKVIKKQEEKKKKEDKWAALKAMIKANQGSKEGNIRASG